MRKLLFTLAIGLSYFTTAQNLVSNPEFGSSSTIHSRGQIDHAAGWSNANGGSVDLFTAKSSKYQVGIPTNFMGTQESNANYIGFTAYYDDQVLDLGSTLRTLSVVEKSGYHCYSEYPQAELKETLTAGQKYSFTIEVSLADKSGRAVKGLGAYFTNTPMNHSNNRAINHKPQITFKELANNKTGWQKLTGEFVASGGERYVVIGAFEGNFTVEKIVSDKKENDNKRAYYYMNGISLTKVLEKDSDGDGVLDKDDPCPNEYGTVNGCPDRDGDGVADKDDKCPDTPGLKELNGCPKDEKDTDGDGVPDSRDECPTVKGTVNGCPDRDGDGVPDKDDECPDEKGKKELKGCPLSKSELEVLKRASEAIYFNTGSAVIKPESYDELDKMAEILKKNPEVEARIEGHTDSQGNDATNLKLSKDRAKAVKDYLIKKGVEADHLDSEGYGETRPIADNGTADGRAKNRRVVIITGMYTEKIKR